MHLLNPKSEESSAMRPSAVDEERRSGEDRRGIVWLNPQFIVGLLVQIITTTVAVTVVVVTMRGQISNALEKIAELRGQVSTLQSLVQVTTAQQGKLDAYSERIAKLENAVDTQTKAYNYDFTTRLARVEAKNGIFKKGD